MVKILKRRPMSVNDEDRNTLRLFRQQVYLLEQQKTYQMITDQEYDRALKELSGKVALLEAKYGEQYQD